MFTFYVWQVAFVFTYNLVLKHPFKQVKVLKSDSI